MSRVVVIGAGLAGLAAACHLRGAGHDVVIVGYDDEREIAIQVDAVTGIAGRVAPGDLVDVYAIFGTAEDGVSRNLVRNVRVISVGGQQTRTSTDGQGALADEAVVPVTLALDPQEP